MSTSPPDRRALAVPASRLSRFTRLGSMTAGVAGNMALQGMGALSRGQRPDLRTLLLTPGNVTRIADQLAEMRGAAMKVGQLISMETGEMLPPELSQIMARLRADAHFMPPAQLKKVFNYNWPTDWLRHFRGFDVHPIAAASIGQVHKAVLKNGQKLAIKVQYPGVARSIDSDVANVGALIRMSGLLPKGFDLAPYLEEARLQLHEETDYAREGRYLSRFGELLGEDPRFALPRLNAEWTTPDILAMDFMEGVPIEDAAGGSKETGDNVAEALIDLLLRELFDFGLMQTDPNFANYRFNPANGRIVLLDFGATRQIDPGIAGQYRRLIRAGFDRDRDGLAALSLEIGFFNKETAPRHRDSILDMMQMVFTALDEGDFFDFAQTDLPKRMQREGIALAEDGFIPPPVPVDVLFLQRKFGGIFLLASRLGAGVKVRSLIETYL